MRAERRRGPIVPSRYRKPLSSARTVEKKLGPGHTLETIGKNMVGVGCGLTLLVTVPIVLLFLLALAC